MGECMVHHVKRDCRATPGCYWCQNIFSPMPGSDGVCTNGPDTAQLPRE
jgi:hypothetical protein